MTKCETFCLHQSCRLAPCSTTKTSPTLTEELLAQSDFVLVLAVADISILHLHPQTALQCRYTCIYCSQPINYRQCLKLGVEFDLALKRKSTHYPSSREDYLRNSKYALLVVFNLTINVWTYHIQLDH
jgi:hypothetical protein